MATVNLGSIKFKWKGTYSGATAYTIDDVVEYNGSSYICILASTGNLPTNATYFEQMSAKGTDGTNGTNGTDLTTTLTTQGDIVYRDASGLARLGAGTNGQALITGGTGANPSWGDVGGGILQVKKTLLRNVTTVSANNTAWVDVTGHSVSITPTANDSAILILGMINLGGVTSGNNRLRVRLLRDSTHITDADTTGSRLNGFLGIYEVDGYEAENRSLVWWDTPNTTSQVTYKIQTIHNSGTTETIYFNQAHNDANNNDTMRGVTSYIVMEISNGVL